MITRQHLARIELICRYPAKLGGFYRRAFGFTETATFSFAGPGFASLIDVPGATAAGVALRLGRQDIALTAIRPPGQPYPSGISGWDPRFQHLAIVAADMAQAYARLCAVEGWTAISTDGPQLLPASSGGVSAFKFRDPEGHPLELIAFAPGSVPAKWQQPSGSDCLGIDHSAISVADTATSIAFYQTLGLHRSGGSLNDGPEQSRLDDIAGAVVEVTALALPVAQAGPHVELLCYRGDFKRPVSEQRSNDAAATRLVFALESAGALAALCARLRQALVSGPVGFVDGGSRALLRDPDGHLIGLEAPH